MADDKTYKELIIKLSNNQIKEYENKNFSSNSLISRQNQNIFGATFSMQNCISYMLVQDNEITIKNIRTINFFQKFSNQNYITFTRILLPSTPIKNIFPIYYNENEYLLIVFTKNNIQNYAININIDDANKKNFLICDFNKNILNITSQVEFCGKTKENNLRFCLACENGKIFVIELMPDYQSSELIVNKVKDIGFTNQGFFSYLTSSLLNSKNTNKEIKNKKGNNNINSDGINIPINSVNYIGNDIVCILRNNYLFELININTGYIFFSYYLYDNIDNKEFISDSKIVSTVDESFTDAELKSTRRKIFYVFIYINSHNINSLISFQLMFVDIPMNNISSTINDFNYFYSTIDIGTNLRLKNRNNTIIYGEIIDMIINDNKLWLLFLNKDGNKNKNFLINNNGIGDDLDKLKEIYGLKILNIFENSGNDGENEIIENNEYFNYNYYEVLVDYNEKNLFYLLSIIKQLGYNLNNNNNISKKNNEIYNNNNDYNIILEQNKTIFSCLLNDKYFLTENIINFVNEKFNTEFKNKNLCFKYLENKYLSINNNNEMGSIINDIILPLIQNEFYMNNIISLGSFRNNDLNSVTFIRQKELSFINVVDSFEKMNDYIKEYEYQIRKLNSNEKLIKEYIHSNLINKNNDNNLNINKSVPLLLIFALNRIYLTEINLKAKNEKYLENIFINKNLEQFKNEIIKENLSCQMNPYNNLEFIHELINEIYSIYKDIIEENIYNIFNMYINEYENKENDNDFKKLVMDLQNISINDKINTININNKYCEIITKIILSRVDALYNVANDVFCFKQWLNLYEDLINVEIPLNINENNIDNFYIKNLILFIFCNHLTNYNTENISRINIEAGNNNNNDLLNDKIVTWLEKFVFNKFSQLGYDILSEQKNKFINYVICLIIKDLFPNNINNNNNSVNSDIIKELVNNKDYQLLNIYNLILINSGNCIKTNIRDALKLLVICNAANDDINNMKDNLIFLYQRHPNYDSDNNNKINNQKYINNLTYNYLHLRNYLTSPNVFISQDTLKNFFILNYDLLMNIFLSFIEKKNGEDEDIEINIDIDDDDNNMNNNKLFKENIIKCLIYIVGDIIDSCFEENEDLCLIVYSKIENLLNNSRDDKNLNNIYNRIKNEILLKISNKVFNTYNINKKITPTILKLSKLNKSLLFDICQIIEKNLTYNKNNNQVNDNNNNNKNNIIENKIEIYYFLNICYTSLMRYEHLINVSKQIIEILDIYINIENISLEELIYFYNQKIFALKNEINAYYKKKQLNSFISQDENDLEKINKEKIITEIKVEELNFYAINKKENDDIQENDILKIKKDNSTFLDYVFEFNILKEVIEADLVKCLDFSDAKLFVYNLLNRLEYDVNQNTNEQSKLLELFIKNVYSDKNKYNDEYMFITLEMLIRLNHTYLNSNNFEKILKTLEYKNKIRLQELLYSLTQQK